MQSDLPPQRNTAAEVGSIGRAARVLECLGGADAALGVSEVARRTGISKSSVHRVAGELVEYGLIERQGSGYRLGLRLFELGQRVPRQRDLRDAARPFMSDLQEATGHSVHLAVLDGLSIVYLDVMRGPSAPPLPIRAGGRWPAHGTGIGKAILAFSSPDVVEAVLAGGLPRLNSRTITTPGLFTAELARIRERGIAFDLEESRPGVACVACPLVGADGDVVAGLSVSGWHNRINVDHSAVAVRTAALGVSRQLADHRQLS